MIITPELLMVHARSRLQNKPFGDVATRLWVWESDDAASNCAVLDINIDGARFAFNLIPGAEQNCSVEFVARNRILAKVLANRKWAGRSMLAQNVPPDTAWNQIEAFVARIPRRNVSARPKVGVLTLPQNQNFGGNLQAFALTETLRELGCDPVLLDRRPARKATRGKAEVPGLTESIALPRAPNNTQFLDGNIGAISTPLLDGQDLAAAVAALGLDSVVVGSDQVWRPQYAKSLLPDFFLTPLRATGKQVRKISYAASFGADSWEYDADNQAMARDALRAFDAVSCREDVGTAMCQTHLDRKATHVLDPTLLVAPARYRQMLPENLRSLPTDGQIVTYVLDPTPEADALITEASLRLNLPASMTTGHPYASQNALTGPRNRVERWVGAISGAGLVITDSFHGTAFSILFNRPFVALCNSQRGSARFASILRLLGLESRLVIDGQTPDLAQLLAPIDWDDVNARLDAERAKSRAFLAQALGIPPAPEGQGKPAKVDATAPATYPVATTGLVPQARGDLPVLCTGCGACASEQGVGARMSWDDAGFLAPTGRLTADALRVCPFNPDPAPEVRDEDALGQMFFGNAPLHDGDGGHYRAAFIGHSPAWRTTSSSGGLATHVFDALLRGGHADRLFVVRGDADRGYSYQVFEPGEDMRKLSKTRYLPVTLAGLYDEIAARPGRVAVSGVACFVKSVRLKQARHPELRERIVFVVGIICGGLKSSAYTDYLASRSGIEGRYTNAEYRVKNDASTALDYSFAADDVAGRRHQVRMARLGDMWGSGLFKAKACDFCNDVTTELADLSLGDAWLPEYMRDGLGTSVAVARSPLAETLLRKGIADQTLELSEVPIAEVVRSQQGGYDHKRATLRFRVELARMNASFLIPHVRERVLVPITAGDAVVQVLRERVRSKSHLNWQRAGRADPFGRSMAASRELLRVVTRMRKSNRRPIERATRQFLRAPSHIPDLSGDLAALMPIARWARRAVRSGQLTTGQIAQLLGR